MPQARFPKSQVHGVVEVGQALVAIIKDNIIAKTATTANVASSATIVPVVNTFQFRPKEEVILIDNGYGVQASPHYKKFEYATLQSVSNTNAVVVSAPIVGDWTIANHTSMQKTIGHAPLYEQNVYYGDREVMPLDQMAVAVEPKSLGNEWMYLQGGLSEEYRFEINVYGRDIKMDEGKIIIDKYTDAIYQLLNENMHFNVDNYDAPILADANANATMVTVDDTPENRAQFVPYDPSTDHPTRFEYPYSFELQDNHHVSYWLQVTSVNYVGGNIQVFFTPQITDAFKVSEFAILKRVGRYIYDSRVDNVTYGAVQKGAAFLRMNQLSWYCKWVNEFTFPQTANNVKEFSLSPPIINL